MARTPEEHRLAARIYNETYARLIRDGISRAHAFKAAFQASEGRIYNPRPEPSLFAAYSPASIVDRTNGYSGGNQDSR